jgi:glycosyltransferase involved in cell wall biosynthesis
MSTSQSVSIILPVYNAGEYLHQAIDSIICQSYQDFEVLICDDASKDNSIEIINNIKDKRFKKIFNQKNLGNLFTVNKLIAEARGNYVAFIDADDWMEFNKIENQVSFLEKNPEVSLCGTNYIRTDNEKNELFCSNFPLDHHSIVNVSKNEGEPQFCFGSIMVRKKVLEKVGGFRPFFNRIGAADFDWLFRIMEQFPTANLRDPLYYYRDAPYSFTSDVTLNPRKAFSKDIAFFLAQQRWKDGRDALEGGSQEELNYFLWLREKVFREDPSLMFRNIAYNKIWKNENTIALLFILIALIRDLSKVANYKLFNYWVYNTIWKKFKR